MIFKKIKDEWTIFLVAFVFFSRIRIKIRGEIKSAEIAKSITYMPLIGMASASVAFGVYYLSNFIFPQEISILLLMIVSVLFTGALHEDGFADFCDGFGGGYSKEKILIIMQDSRIGVYGVIGIIFILILKYVTLIHIPKEKLFLTLLLTYSLSRITPVWIVKLSRYAKQSDSKSGAMAFGISGWRVLAGSILSCIFLFFFKEMFYIFVLITILIVYVFRQYIEKKIQGFTGDCLGAIQQISESTLLLASIVNL